MSKIQLMGSGAYDVYCTIKRVFWRPETPATVIKVGQPICYNNDSVQDHKERAADPSHLGLTQDTYEEGAQEFTGRLFIVEEPLTANLDHFAGIVKSLGPEAGADGDMLEIFVPTEGAIVPVWTDIECTRDQTILGLRNGEADASYTQYAKAIGVAKETKDRSGTPGLVWMEFKSFIEQGDYSYPLIIPDESAGDVIVNHAYYQSVQTAGAFHLMKARVELTGNAGFEGGMVQYRGEINGVDPATSQVVSIGITIKANGELAATGYQYGTCPLHLGVGTSGTPDLSGGGDANTLCAISIAYNADESGGAPVSAYVFHFNSGTYKWDGLIHAMNAGDLGDWAETDRITTSAAGDRIIPVRIGGNMFHLVAYANDGLA